MELSSASIGVLMGGVSAEREISLKSGEAVYEALKSRGFNVVVVDLDTDDMQINYEFLKDSGIDIAFIALHGGFGEDGRLQALLERMNLPYTGSDSRASELAMNKIRSRQIFQEQNLAVPRFTPFEIRTKGKTSRPFAERAGLFRTGFTVFSSTDFDFSFPLVVKPANQGSSIGLSIVNKEADLLKAVECARNFSKEVIIEEYIPGREVTVGILGERALPVIEIVPENRFFDYEAKYDGKSEYIVPADLPSAVTAKLKESALLAHRSLGCSDFSRVDMRLTPDNLAVVLEVNTIPGLTKASLLPKAAACVGFDFSALCTQILELAYQKGRVFVYKRVLSRQSPKLSSLKGKPL
ncbi:MAG: D-alanine--D-alanine ligase [Candidatus Omnitrophica bacterium]|nr:D-alanine--D-alanine ligase [Candidatus Omnitrophota bacterium]